MVVKEKGGYVVKSESGKNLSKPYASEQEAKQRLRVIEYFKHKAVAKELRGTTQK